MHVWKYTISNIHITVLDFKNIYTIKAVLLNQSEILYFIFTIKARANGLLNVKSCFQKTKKKNKQTNEKKPNKQTNKQTKEKKNKNRKERFVK